MPRIEQVSQEGKVTFKICIDSVEDGKKLIRQIESALNGHDDQEDEGGTMIAPAGVNYSININC